MPKITESGSQPSQFYPIHTRGPVAQFFVPLMPATSLDASGDGAAWSSGALVSDGFRAISAGVTLARAGTIALTRYVDDAGVVVLDTTTVDLSAGTPGAVAVNDGKPFGSYKIDLANTDSGGTSAVSNFAALLEAA